MVVNQKVFCKNRRVKTVFKLDERNSIMYCVCMVVCEIVWKIQTGRKYSSTKNIQRNYMILVLQYEVGTKYIRTKNSGRNL